MGTARDIMQAFAGRDLHARFPEYEGWVWNELPPAADGCAVYRVTRGDLHQAKEAILAVSVGIRPSHEILERLLTAPAGRTAQRYLLLPQGADLPDRTGGFTPMRMAAFGIVDGKLTWLTRKKNAARYRERGDTGDSGAA